MDGRGVIESCGKCASRLVSKYLYDGFRYVSGGICGDCGELWSSRGRGRRRDFRGSGRTHFAIHSQLRSALSVLWIGLLSSVTAAETARSRIETGDAGKLNTNDDEDERWQNRVSYAWEWSAEVRALSSAQCIESPLSWMARLSWSRVRFRSLRSGRARPAKPTGSIQRGPMPGLKK